MLGITHSANVSAMGSEWLSVSDKRAAVMVALALCASATMQNSSAVLVIVTMVQGYTIDRAYSDLRDGILCKREILHQHVQAFILLI